MNRAAGWAAGLAAASVAVGGGGGRLLLGRVRVRRPARRPGAARASARRRSGPAPALAAVTAAGAAVAYGRPLLGCAALLVLACVARERRTARRARAAAGEERRVREFAALAAAELRAGRAARDALARAARDVALLPDPPAGPWAMLVADAAESGDDVAVALERGTAAPGAGALRDLAACWRVAEGTGAGLAAALDVVTAGLREREARRREMAAQLAGVRATGWLLAGLPFFGLALGGALGAQPWRVLLDTGAGNAALAAGLALEAAGLAWLGRLVRGVQR